MRIFNPQLAAVVNSSIMGGLCLAYRFTKRDGETLYFADIDRARTFADGHTYEPDVVTVMGSITVSADDAASSVDIEVVASADTSFTFQDVQDGLYNGAEVEILLCDRNNPTTAMESIYWGEISEVRWDDTGHINLTLGGMLARARTYVAELFGGSCRAIFTDERCKVPKADVTFYDAVVTEANGRFITVSGPGHATDHFNLGLLTFTSGRLKGRAREIRKSTLATGQELELYIGFGVNPQIGDVCDVRQGCAYDLSSKGCPRYNNILNYRGEPYIDPEPVVTDAWTTPKEDGA